jgi:alkaline phosphatase D
MKVTRRTALKGAAVLGSATVVGCNNPTPAPMGDAGMADGGVDAYTPPVDAAPSDAWRYDGGPPPTGTFQHGVASGDPLPNAVMLWTRVSEQTAAVDVTWEIATDSAFASVVTMGTFMTDASRDYTVKVDATGLSPATTYYYRFTLAGTHSPIGRTKTAPMGAVSRLRFAFCTCANLANGFFYGYRRIAERADLDAVIHLGDYIYEFQNGYYGSLRDYDPPTEILSLDDYRRRYRQYRLDPDLQEAHRQHPWITTWDDHEFANNAWMDGAQNHMPATEGAWADRKAAAMQAYREWLPYREPAGGGIRRNLVYGDLAELIVLDTRIEGRMQQSAGDAATRELLGTAQKTALFDRLMNSTAQWKIVVQQVMLAKSAVGSSDDQWEGYPLDRNALLSFLHDNAITNTVVLTGDFHSSFANDIPLDPAMYDAATGAGSVCVEFICPAISSPAGLTNLVANNWRNAMMTSAQYIKYLDPFSHGYSVLDVDTARVQSGYFFVADIQNVDRVAGGMESAGGAYSIADGTSHLVMDTAPAAPITGAPPLAP